MWKIVNLVCQLAADIPVDAQPLDGQEAGASCFWFIQGIEKIEGLTCDEFIARVDPKIEPGEDGEGPLLGGSYCL